jgi:hypothetical protein
MACSCSICGAQDNRSLARCNYYFKLSNPENFMNLKTSNSYKAVKVLELTKLQDWPMLDQEKSSYSGSPLSRDCTMGWERTRGRGVGCPLGQKRRSFYLVFSRLFFLSLIEHVKTFTGRYLPEESLCLPICLKNVSLEVANKTWITFN